MANRKYTVGAEPPPAEHMIEARIVSPDEFTVVAAPEKITLACRCGWTAEIDMFADGAHLPKLRAKIAEHKAEIATSESA